MKLWKQSTALIVILFIAFAIHLTLGGPADTKYQNHYRKNNEAENRQGLLAGPMFLALSSMFFPVLPLVMMAPLAIAGLGPAVGYITDAISSNSPSSSSSSGASGQSSQAINDALQTLTSSNSALGSAFSQLTNKHQSTSVGSTGPSSSPASASSASAFSSIKKISQALGLSESTVGEPETASSSIISSFFADPDKKGSSSSILNSFTGNRPSSGIGGADASKVKPSSDLLGAAAAALDNAGLLGPISGAGTGSVAEQILNLVTGNKVSSSASSSASSASSASPGTPSTSALSSLLGLSSEFTPSVSGLSSSSPPNVYTSLASGKPSSVPGASLSAASSALNSVAAAAATASSSPASSGNIQKLANNALNRISDFIFTRRRSSTGQSYSSLIPSLPSLPSLPSFDAMSGKAKLGLFSYVKDVFSTLKDGVKRYEISESECQARLMCELNQKAVGRSLKSWANSVFDLFNVEDYLDKSTFTSRTKSTAKDMLRAAREGLNEKDCAKLYSRCPVHVVEATKNHFIAQVAAHQAQQESQQLQQHQQQQQQLIKQAKTHQVNRVNGAAGPVDQSNANRHQIQPITKPIAVTLQPNRLDSSASYNKANSPSSQFKPITYTTQ